jgi:hypothetical protein
MMLMMSGESSVMAAKRFAFSRKAVSSLDPADRAELLVEMRKNNAARSPGGVGMRSIGAAI